ncbi:hypothetical protein M3194_15660 [Paenibacillus glycanilyticus]|uniref:hypothetical protein n=1 Tax=Paenibacillus glycanilyticus TaxID=126569 RepID=UPI002040AF6F|nr:hypothetical protein [Paenibacillus glycanilyticus]MCM3628780.1 hypothetical protein [Paenibacillus glycanilyticus]
MNKPQLLTQGELNVIRQCILLPLLVHVIDKNMDDLKYSDSTFKDLYMTSTEVVLDFVNRDYLDARQQLSKAKIKLVEAKPTADYEVNYTVYFRGYQEQFRLMKNVVTAQIRIALGNYVREVGDLVKKIRRQ